MTVCLICYCACAEMVMIVLLPQMLSAKLSILSRVLYRAWIFANLAAFWTILCACAATATFSVKFDSIFELSVPDFLYHEKFWKLGHNFRYFLANFLLHMRRNGRKTTSGEIFNPKFETFMGCFLFDYEFWWHLLQELCVFLVKNGFRNAKYSGFVATGGGVTIFWRNPQKAHLWLISRILAIMRANPFRGFSSRRAHEKRNAKKITETLYFTYLQGILHSIKFN